jgi:starch synthase
MALRIAHLASEVVPFSKTGGLADVTGALPVALAALGHHSMVIAPAHRTTLATPLPGVRAGEVEALGLKAAVHVHTHRKVEVVLLDCPLLYVRPAIYSLPDGDFPDNALRFAFFARAALQALALLGGADVVHAHDWQAALAPLLLAHEPELWAAVGAPRSVLTIHNMAYQGTFAPWVLEPCGLPARLFTTEWLEFYGQVNFLKGGLASADAITTVSPTYAREILTPEFGCRLDGVLMTRKGAVSGIVNGLDLEVWDPAGDPHLPEGYTLETAAAGKQAAREALSGETLLSSAGRPLAGMVSRLAEQKGADLLAAAVGEIVGLGFDVVVLGTGDRRYEELLQAAELAYPGRVKLLLRFDEGLAHRIYAASDVFLMPSRYEPCGLGQMSAMRYGSLPVVHRTGGLADTVTDAAEPDGTGFVFDEPTAAALVAALSRARGVLADPKHLAAMRRAAMTRDFSWAASAKQYLALYQKLLAPA